MRTAHWPHVLLVALLGLGCALSQLGCSDSDGSGVLGFRVANLRFPNGQVGVPYSETIITIDGKAPVNHFVLSGALPLGLSLDPATGIIAGTPAIDGEVADFRLRLVDADGLTLQPTYTIVILKDVQITTNNLPDGVFAGAYVQQLQASGGTPPYSWELTGGTLPAGMTLNRSTGQVIGTPLSRGTFSPTFTVRDIPTAAGQAADTETFTFQVN